MHLKHLSMAVSCGAIAMFAIAETAAAQAAPAADVEARAVQQRGASIDVDDNPNEWIVAGYGGPSFGDDIDESNTAIGGVVTYLRDRKYGVEAMANFTPNFAYAPAELGESAVNNYMVNGVAAMPVGDTGTFQPFVSAGVGLMTINGETEIDDPVDPFEYDDAQFAGNVGVGVLGFQDDWGLRTSLRYFTGFGDEDAADIIDDLPEVLDPNDLLADTSFWQFDVGVAYRW